MTLRVLITGVNGFIGRSLAQALCTAGHRVFGISLEAEGRDLPPSCQYRSLDITNEESIAALLGEEHFDAIVHLAALVHVRDAKLSFADYARLNYRASESLFQLAAKRQVSRLVFASTVEVYGSVSNGSVVTETAPCRPESDYARTKLLAEQSLAQIAEAHGLHYCALRFGPVYAPDFRLNIDKRLYLKKPNLAYRLGGGDYKISLCSVRNIEFWVTRWLETNAPPNGVFNLADPATHTAKELIALERDHKQARVVLPLPFLPCLAALAVREMALNTRGLDAGMYTTSNFRKLARSTTWCSNKAILALGDLPGRVETDLYKSH